MFRVRPGAAGAVEPIGLVVAEQGGCPTRRHMLAAQSGGHRAQRIPTAGRVVIPTNARHVASLVHGGRRSCLDRIARNVRLKKPLQSHWAWLFGEKILSWQPGLVESKRFPGNGCRPDRRAAGNDPAGGGFRFRCFPPDPRRSRGVRGLAGPHRSDPSQSESGRKLLRAVGHGV